MDSKHFHTGRIESLGSFGPKAKAAIPALGSIVKTELGKMEPNFRRIAAAGSLACIGSDAVPILVEILKERDFPTPVRQTAIWALGRMAKIHGSATPREAVSPLAKALDDKDSQVRFEIVTALACMEEHSKAARPALTDALDDSVAKIRIGSAYALFKIDPENKVTAPALIKGLKETDGEARCFAAYQLARMGVKAEPAVPTLRTLLLDSDTDVRVNAILALAEIGRGAKEALPDLKTALRDKDKRISECAAYAIKAIEQQANK